MSKCKSQGPTGSVWASSVALSKEENVWRESLGFRTCRWSSVLVPVGVCRLLVAVARWLGPGAAGVGRIPRLWMCFLPSSCFSLFPLQLLKRIRGFIGLETAQGANPRTGKVALRPVGVLGRVPCITSETDITVSSTGNFIINTLDHVKEMRNNAFVGNSAHFDTEIGSQRAWKARMWSNITPGKFVLFFPLVTARPARIKLHLPPHDGRFQGCPHTTSSSSRSRRRDVGGWKPISCGEPTFVQSSVVGNEEFVSS